MKHVLITGGGGQLAKGIANVAQQFKELQLDVMDSAELDITAKDKVARVFDKKAYHYCVNCAAYTAVDEAEKNPDRAFEVNSEAVKNLAELCKENEVVLIQVSTDYVFDGNKEKGYMPTDKPNPINVYGTSKLKGEEYIKEILDRYFIIRTSWLYDKENENFYTRILNKARKGENLRVTDAQRGCPTHVETVANYILKLITGESTDFGIHHVTDNIAMTWYDFARQILEEHGLLETVSLVRDKNYRSFAPRPAHSVLLRTTSNE